ncbi:MAG TPA: CusA/CzcA family heavy metal efflux RND transporter [Candidatus Krumholzibacteria bacterium]|nr:CusA/CzcA family heavy metal efflux RND transporter [Candidatus Krumholzibacteria bacterium]HPD70448.1 CusA/CzcA family heavy metal efflux RND transporter [Candidatus Krumholzibacteria bacterium]HRY39852.1 CusA/CzcA family heavy metal efflux RND transporter [Candidatus Krumholzibacteria bacterium]
MVSRLLRFALANRSLVVFGTLLFAGLGGYALWRLPLDAFPDTTPIQVQINTVASALAPEEIEQQITLPIELALGGLPGLVDVRSISKFGFSQVVVTFADLTPIIDARQHVTERLAQVELPDGVAAELGPIATGLGEVFHYLVRSTDPQRSLEDLRTIHDWLIKPELRKVAGVAEVNSWGGKVRQFHVVISPERLARYDLTVSDVVDALQANNRNVGGGVVTAAGLSRVVHGQGRVGSLDDIAAVIVTSRDGRPIYVRDVAENVEIGHEIRRGAATAQGGGEVVLGLAFTLMGENPANVTAALKERLAAVAGSLPADVEVEVVYDRTELTAAVIHTVEHNLVLGALLVVAVLYLVLGNLRAGLIVAATIPLAMVGAALGMQYAAIAASLLSLGAIDFGILVDGAVVVAEASMRRLADRRRALGRALSGGERREAVRDASAEVGRPVVFGMVIILIVFLPILGLQGTEGKLFRPMALTFMFALAASLALALVLTPVLSASFLPEAPSALGGRVNDAMQGGYRRLLERALRRRGLVLWVAAGLLAAGAAAAARLGGEFLPRLKEGAIVINTVRLAGVAIDESARQNTLLERLLLEEFPDEIRSAWSRIGTAEVATDPMGPELTDIFLALHPRDRWRRARTQEELTAAITRVASEFPGASFAFTQPIEMRLNEMASGIRTDLGVKIFGDDFAELVRLGEAVARVLEEIPGHGEVAIDQVVGQPEIVVRVDREALLRHGVAADEVLQAVAGMGGIEVGEVYEGLRPFPLVVRWPDRFREDRETLAGLLVTSATGARQPLGELAEVEEVDGLATINREWGRRLVRVQCSVSGRDVMSFVDEARRRIAAEVPLTTGYFVEWGGQFEHLERAQRRLSVLVPTALALVLGLLYLSLRRVRDVAIIATGIPFAFLGGVVALHLRGLPFSVSAAVGFIALAGIAVLNGQVLVAALRERLGAGLAPPVAVVEAAVLRLRPVIATAITDAAGFVPMAVSSGVGAEIQRPLATVVIGGVLSSTVLTLFVLPALYRVFGTGRSD